LWGLTLFSGKFPTLYAIDEEEKSGKTVKSAIYWALLSGDF
jgi:hypothetical protein